MELACSSGSLEVPFEVDEVLVGAAGAPLLFIGLDSERHSWLVAQVDQDVDARRWLCAPASDLALHCLRTGRAQPGDLLLHSATGAVEDITIGSDGRIRETTRLCAELNDDEAQALCA